MGLLQKAYRGAGWSGLSGILTNGMELLKYIVLARILVPGDFGLLAMTMVIVSICRIFADGGTSNAVIHFRNHSGRQLSTLFWINVGAGSVLYALVIAAAPLFAGFYNEPDVSTLLRLAGVILPLYAIGALYEVLMRKSLSFKQITIVESISALLSFATAVVLAYTGWGVYSLIWSHIVMAASMTLLYTLIGMHRWKPSLSFELAEVLPHLRFGLFQMGDRGLNVYSTRVDQLIIGRFFGPEILGGYHLAWQIILFPVLRLSPLLNRVAFPVFASRQDDDAVLRNGYLKLMSGITSLVTPFFLVAGISAPWLVPLLFGSGWELTIQLLPIMAMLGFLRMLGNPSGNIVLSKGRAALAFYWNLGVSVINTCVFLIGAQFSIFILLGLYTITNLFYFVTGQWLMVNRLIGMTWTRFLYAIAPFLLTLVVPWFGAWLFRNWAGGVWQLQKFAGQSYGIKAAFTDLLSAWHNVGLWYEQALWNEALMVIFIATLFIILYIPVFWKYQAGLVREFYRALRSSDPH